MIDSVARLISFCPRKNPFFSNLSGAHATNTYRVFSVWGSPYCAVAPTWEVWRGWRPKPRASLAARASSSCAGEERVGRGIAGSVAVDAGHASGTCSGSAGSDVACVVAERTQGGVDARFRKRPSLGRLGFVRRCLQKRLWTGRALVLIGRDSLPTLRGGEKLVYCTLQLPVFGDLRRRPPRLANANAGAGESRETTHPWCRAESGLLMRLQGTLPSCAAPGTGRSFNWSCQCSPHRIRILDVGAMAKRVFRERELDHVWCMSSGGTEATGS